MINRLIFLCLIVSWGCGGTPTTDNQAEPDTPPNVVFVFADQWRSDAVGFAGNADVITPNLDRLAEESILFENAIAVTPVCAPWRASFLTGQYPLTNGLFYNDKPLSPQANTLGKVFKEAGYATGYIGKWHLNGHERGTDPLSGRDKPIPKDRRHGFDYWKVREVTHDYNNSFYFDEEDNRHVWEGYDVFPQTDSAVSFIQKNRSQPFLLVLSYGPPHDPYFTAPKEFADLYRDKSLGLRQNVPQELADSARNVLAGYYAHCTAIDRALGSLLKGLEDAGVADNTLFIFTSDHGDMLLSRGVLKKQRPWDESIKVPMLMRWPKGFGQKPRKVLDPINTPDLAPTLIGLSKLDVPESMEGEDFSSQLMEGVELGNEAALITLPVPFHEWQFMRGGREYRGVRTRDYTYVKDLLGPWLLYDNAQDPFQLTNLVDVPQYEQVQIYLDDVLNRKLAETQDEFLPADTYMRRRGYLYDRSDSIRPPNYLEINRD